MNSGKILPVMLAAAVALGSGAALAESQYGMGVDGVKASAAIQLRVNVPNLILLRVGSAGATVDELEWTTGFKVPSGTELWGSGTGTVDWTGEEPTGIVKEPEALAVYAWTNNREGGGLTFEAGEFAGAGPKLKDVKVKWGNDLPHPGENLGEVSDQKFGPFKVAQDKWLYTLDGSQPADWAAGVYETKVVYIAYSL